MCLCLYSSLAIAKQKIRIPIAAQIPITAGKTIAEKPIVLSMQPIKIIGAEAQNAARTASAAAHVTNKKFLSVSSIIIRNFFIVYN